MNEKTCRSIVYERSDGLCERCGKVAHSVHHRRKRSQGGPWTPGNCVHVCGDGVRGCHGWIENNPNKANDEGFHVRGYQNECEVPVYIFGELVYLLDDGTKVPAEEFDHAV